MGANIFNKNKTFVKLNFLTAFSRTFKLFYQKSLNFSIVRHWTDRPPTPWYALVVPECFGFTFQRFVRIEQKSFFKCFKWILFNLLDFCIKTFSKHRTDHFLFRLLCFYFLEPVFLVFNFNISLFLIQNAFNSNWSLFLIWIDYSL